MTIHCKYLVENNCKLVEKLTSLPCPVTTECYSCTQGINLITLNLAATSERKHPRTGETSSELEQRIQSQYDISKLGQGFGTRLHRLLSPFLPPTPKDSLSSTNKDSLSSTNKDSLSSTNKDSLSEIQDCECNNHKDILDLWTPKYIEDNIDQVVSWLADSSRQKRIPFSYTLTKYLLLSLLKFEKK